MRAAVLEAHGEPLSIEDVSEPQLAPHGVIVSVEACGICRSDWHAWQGHHSWVGDRVDPGQILGHEPAGRVVEVGEQVSSLTAGDFVAIPFNLGDGTCPHCRRGRTNYCENLSGLGFSMAVQGAWAEQVHVPYAEHNAIRLPDGVAAADVAALGCRFMTAYNGLEHRADLGAGDWVAVHGCGGVGLSAIHVVDALGGRPIAVDIDPEALALADELGAEATVNAAEANAVPEVVRSIADGGVDIAVDALGIAETCRNAIDCLGTRGTHLQLGLSTEAERGEIALPTDVIAMQGIDVLGSRGMPPVRYTELFGLIESGAIDPGALVTQTVELDAVSDRLQAMTTYDTVGIEVITTF
ncbi:MAG: alcohol dehydrogenase catalytic domain-containing protein [Halobacteriales archaeon]